MHSNVQRQFYQKICISFSRPTSRLQCGPVEDGQWCNKEFMLERGCWNYGRPLSFLLPYPPPPITRPFLSRPSETGPEAGVQCFSGENFEILHCRRRVLAHSSMLNVVWKAETQCFTSQLHFFAEKYWSTIFEILGTQPSENNSVTVTADRKQLSLKLPCSRCHIVIDYHCYYPQLGFEPVQVSVLDRPVFCWLGPAPVLFWIGAGPFFEPASLTYSRNKFQIIFKFR